MQQYNDAVESLKDQELRRRFEREMEEYRDASHEDRKAEKKALQRHYRAIQKEHSKA